MHNIETPNLNDQIKLKEGVNYNLRCRELIGIPLVTRTYLSNNPFLLACRNFNKIADIFSSSTNRNEFKRSIEKLKDDFFL